MKISPGSTTLFASLALAASINETALQNNTFECSDLSGTRRNLPCHATTIYGSFAHPSPCDMFETARCNSVDAVAKSAHLPPEHPHHKARSPRFMAALEDALKKTASILSKSFKVPNKNDISPVVPLTPPNTPAILPPELVGLGLSSVIPVFENMSPNSSFCYNDEWVPFTTPSPSITASTPSNTPTVNDSSFVLHDLETALETCAANSLTWFYDGISAACSSFPIQPPNTPNLLSAAMAYSVSPLVRNKGYNATSGADMHVSVLPNAVAANETGHCSESEPTPATSQNTEYRASSPRAYMYSASHNSTIPLFPAQHLHSAFSARQLAYIAICLKYIKD